MTSITSELSDPEVLPGKSDYIFALTLNPKPKTPKP